MIRPHLGEFRPNWQCYLEFIKWLPLFQLLLFSLLRPLIWDRNGRAQYPCILLAYFLSYSQCGFWSIVIWVGICIMCGPTMFTLGILIFAYHLTSDLWPIEYSKNMRNSFLASCLFMSPSTAQRCVFPVSFPVDSLLP